VRPEIDPTETSGRCASLWTATAPRAPLDPLRGDVHVDVCIVGAGIAGLTTAYFAAREGLGVVVLDDGAVGSGETGRTTAHLTAALDDRYATLERLHGAEAARLAATSHRTAIGVIEHIVGRESIPCDFERVDGYLFASPGRDPADLDEELTAARRAGLEGVTRVPHAPLDAFDTGPALRFPAQGQLHPLRYLSGLAAAVAARGGRIHTGSHAAKLERDTPLRVHVADGPVVTARAVVVATNAPVFDLTTIHTKQAAYRSYVVVLPIPRGSVDPLLLWDTGGGHARPDPYHYVRIVRGEATGGSPGHDFVVVGGEDHKTGQDDDAQGRYDALEAWTRERFPVTGPAVHRWSGQVLEPVDGLAHIGLDPGSNHPVYVATGDSGNGMTHGTIAGILLTDLLVGRENPWERLYDPGRVTLGASGVYARENANVAGRYADWLRKGDVASLDDLARGAGAILVRGLRRLAVYRDPEGGLHACSAVCPHLGCVVHWNGVESSWDCPCHGSRFDELGRVVNGPANRDLTPATLDEAARADLLPEGPIPANPGAT
jgi:glycine/D-amino acid oxidase-like deaminating enzyme/nitrite reductase/ring-hydroxylating ferredoxin subunit